VLRRTSAPSARPPRSRPLRWSRRRSRPPSIPVRREDRYQKCTRRRRPRRGSEDERVVPRQTREQWREGGGAFEALQDELLCFVERTCARELDPETQGIQPTARHAQESVLGARTDPPEDGVGKRHGERHQQARPEQQRLAAPRRPDRSLPGRRSHGADLLSGPSGPFLAMPPRALARLPGGSAYDVRGLSGALAVSAFAQGSFKVGTRAARRVTEDGGSRADFRARSLRGRSGFRRSFPCDGRLRPEFSASATPRRHPRTAARSRGGSWRDPRSSETW
jgi:hypothetical protein